MALYASQISVFQINDGSALRDISPYVTAIDGLPGPRELIEVTALGDTGRKWIAGLENVVITLELLWSDDASVGSDTVLGVIRDDAAARAFDYGPEGKDSGDIKYSGTCWVRNYTIMSRVGEKVSARVELQVEGIITRGTYA